MATGDLAVGLRVLADLLDAGLSAHRALGALEQFVSEPLLSALTRIQADLRQGRSLSTSLDSASIGIPPVVIGVIAAGENGGGLAKSVRHAAQLMEEAAAFRSALSSALAYPALLLASGAASVIVLVAVVLPRFAGMLADMGQGLPPATAAVLGVANAARAAALPGAMGGAIVVAAWAAWTRTETGRRDWHTFLLAVPLVGTVRLAAATSRGCGALAGLLSNGLSLATAMPLAGRATGDAALASRFVAARHLLSEGASLSQALAATSAVSMTGIRLARAGEESGRLAAMLGHASRLERERATRITGTGVRLVEPILIISFGVIVAVVAGALLQAVYSVRPGA